MQTVQSEIPPDMKSIDLTHHGYNMLKNLVADLAMQWDEYKVPQDSFDKILYGEEKHNIVFKTILSPSLQKMANSRSTKVVLPESYRHLVSPMFFPNERFPKLNLKKFQWLLLLGDYGIYIFYGLFANEKQENALIKLLKAASAIGKVSQTQTEEEKQDRLIQALVDMQRNFGMRTCSVHLHHLVHFAEAMRCRVGDERYAHMAGIESKQGDLKRPLRGPASNLTQLKNSLMFDYSVTHSSLRKQLPECLMDQEYIADMHRLSPVKLCEIDKTDQSECFQDYYFPAEVEGSDDFTFYRRVKYQGNDGNCCVIRTIKGCEFWHKSAVNPRPEHAKYQASVVKISDSKYEHLTKELIPSFLSKRYGSADEGNSTDHIMEFSFSKYAQVINILVKKSELIENEPSDIRLEDVELDVSFLGLYEGRDHNEHLDHVILDNTKCSTQTELINDASIRMILQLSLFEPISLSLVDSIIKKRTQESIDPETGDRTLIAIPDEANKGVKTVIAFNSPSGDAEAFIIGNRSELMCNINKNVR
eukprot:Nk52_evm36s2118 gene=Nk52_evmTU36s2118